MTKSPQDELYRRYLGILGWVGDPGLHELVSSHLIKVPYENVTQLISNSNELQPIGAFLDGIAERDLGGGNFTIPIHFASLLKFLDYDVELLGADVAGVPRSHAVCRVGFEDTHYLVDIGYGAPFYQPIALNSLPNVILHGDFQFAVDRHVAGAGAVEVTTLRGGNKVQSYVAKPPALAGDGFAVSVQRAADPTHRSLRTLRISRFFASRVLEIYDNNLVTTHHNITTVTAIRDIDEMEAIIRDQLQLTRLPVREAVEVLRGRGVDIFAEG